MKAFERFYATKPGAELFRDVSHVAVFSNTEFLAHFSSNQATKDIGKAFSVGFGVYSDYATNKWTETKDNSGTIAYAAQSWDLILTCGAGANNDTTLMSLGEFTPQLNRWYTGYAIVTPSHATTTGVSFGIGTRAAVDFLGTAPTDGVWLKKATAGATVVGAVNANGTSGANLEVTGTLLTMVAATPYLLGFAYKIGNDYSTTPTAATCTGYYLTGTQSATTGDWTVTKTPMTSAQLTLLAALYNTTLPTSQAVQIGVRAQTASDTLKVRCLCVEGDA